jgi:hypothetical protein
MGEALKALIQQRLAASGKSRSEVIDLLARTNRSKAFRKLDQLLNGEPGGAAFLKEVAEVLSIPESLIAVAVEFDLQREDRERRQRREEEWARWFEKTGPHLWVVLPKDYLPSLITVIGPEFFLLVPVPRALLDLPDYEQFLEVGALARAHFQSPKRRARKVAGYLFRRNTEETFRFSPEGEFQGRTESPSQGESTIGFAAGQAFRSLISGRRERD